MQHLPRNEATPSLFNLRAEIRARVDTWSRKERKDFPDLVRRILEGNTPHSPELPYILSEISDYLMEKALFSLMIGNIKGTPQPTPWEIRLAAVVWAFRTKQVASKLHHTLPKKPGMGSAHCFGTILSNIKEYEFDGTLLQGGIADGGIPENSDPMGSGARWLSRLRKDVKRGIDRGDLIPLMLVYLDQNSEK